jgi:hypothetical protein
MSRSLWSAICPASIKAPSSGTTTRWTPDKRRQIDYLLRESAPAEIRARSEGEGADLSTLAGELPTHGHDGLVDDEDTLGVNLAFVFSRFPVVLVSPAQPSATRMKELAALRDWAELRAPGGAQCLGACSGVFAPRLDDGMCLICGIRLACVMFDHVCPERAPLCSPFARMFITDPVGPCRSC